MTNSNKSAKGKRKPKNDIRKFNAHLTVEQKLDYNLNRQIYGQ